MNADKLELPRGCLIARRIDGVRELAQYDVNNDMVRARWDTVLADGRQMFTMDAKMPNDTTPLEQWLDQTRPKHVKALAAMEKPQEAHP